MTIVHVGLCRSTHTFPYDLVVYLVFATGAVKCIRWMLISCKCYSGIGIVNAIEVVNAFPGKDGLREFREWIESPDPTILGKLDVEAGGNSRKKGSKRSENITSGSSSNLEGISSDQNIPQPVDDAERIKQIFMDKHVGATLLVSLLVNETRLCNDSHYSL